MNTLNDPEFSLETLCGLAQLEPREREAIIDHVILGRSLSAIARDMGISRELVRRLEVRGLEKLRAGTVEAAA